jgi:transmembrane sensor
VGTAFNVRRHSDAVEVLVTEGRVRLDDVRHGQAPLSAEDISRTVELPELAAGERARVPVTDEEMSPPGKATVARVTSVAVQQALAWQERRLEFDSVPLADVAREFNRYNRQQLVIADEELARRRFSGTFRADGYESLVQLLEADFGVSRTNEANAIVLRVRR